MAEGCWVRILLSSHDNVGSGLPYVEGESIECRDRDTVTGRRLTEADEPVLGRLEVGKQDWIFYEGVTADELQEKFQSLVQKEEWVGSVRMKSITKKERTAGESDTDFAEKAEMVKSLGVKK